MADWSSPTATFAAFRFVVRNEHFHFFVGMLIVCLGLLILLLALKLSNQVRLRRTSGRVCRWPAPPSVSSRVVQEYFVWILGLTVVSAHVRSLAQRLH